MNERQQELFESQLISITQRLEYPPTPDIVGKVMERLYTSMSSRGKGSRGEGRTGFAPRQLAWSLAIALILFASLMLIRPARAAILEFIQIGVVRIFRSEPAPSAPPNQEAPQSMVPVTATPGTTPQFLIPILERLAGEMTLDQAQKAVDYPILLPSYPPDLGLPERIFVQEAGGKMTVLVWIDRQHPERVLMSLHFIPTGSWVVEKAKPIIIQETMVRGQPGVWTDGPYFMQLSNGNMDLVRLIDGHVLIWAEGNITYRLETDRNLQEALKIAESLKPIQ